MTQESFRPSAAEERIRARAQEEASLAWLKEPATIAMFDSQYPGLAARLRERIEQTLRDMDEAEAKRVGW